MKTPNKCCSFGEHKCSIRMPIKRRSELIELCIHDIVSALNAGGLTTMASCCGHGKQDGIISLEDGRELIIKNARR